MDTKWLVLAGMFLVACPSVCVARDLVIPCILPHGTPLNEASCNEYRCTWDGVHFEDHPRMKCTWDVSSYANTGVNHTSSSHIEATLTPPAVKPDLLNRELQLFPAVKLEVTCISNTMLRIKYANQAGGQYEVPQDALPTDGLGHTPCDETDYEVILNAADTGVRVIRKSTGAAVLNTNNVGLALSEQFQQITVSFNGTKVYGLGEHNHKRFRHDVNYKTWTIFTRDVGVGDHEWNLYGAQPFFMTLEESNDATGVFLKNSNAMDVFLQPNAVTYRVIGGVLDFYVFTGPGPEDVVKQYTALVGRPLMPPYWSLGFHLCRWGFQNITHVERVLQRNLDAKIPLDVLYGDIDYMYEKLDFTYNPDAFAGLPELVDTVHRQGMKYIIILDPGIHDVADSTLAVSGAPYRALVKGVEQDIFVKDAAGGNLQGRVWPGTVHFPDFTNPNATLWWGDEIREFYQNRSTNITGIEFDALWIDMNEPANFMEGAEAKAACSTNKWNDPHFIPEGLLSQYLSDKTYCMDAQQHWGKAYDVHSLYGHSMAQATYRSVETHFPQKRPFVLSRSTFSGSNKYAIHWLGDNNSGWADMSWAIVGMLEFSLFGFSMTGADICGFGGTTEEEMCQRWMQVGAFYPFSRNHNAFDNPDQDPASFGEEMIASSKAALGLRYYLLPYLYTLMYEAHTEGSTVARPLLHEFVQDEATHDIDRQFMWGGCLLISPVLEWNTTTVLAYFPPTERWYSVVEGSELEEVGWTNLSAPLDTINVHARGGCVMPAQRAGVNTNERHSTPHTLLAYMDKNQAATGTFFLDDGDSSNTITNGNYLKAHITVISNTLLFNLGHNGYAGSRSQSFEEIKIHGVEEEPKQVVVTTEDNIENELAYEYSAETKVLKISDQRRRLPMDQDMTIEWRGVRQTTPAPSTSPTSTPTAPPPTTTPDSGISVKPTGALTLILCGIAALNGLFAA